jgi:hypothetical protein
MDLSLEVESSESSCSASHLLTKLKKRRKSLLNLMKKRRTQIIQKMARNFTR